MIDVGKEKCDFKQESSAILDLLTFRPPPLPPPPPPTTPPSSLTHLHYHFIIINISSITQQD